jgi:hypothetical protein
MIKTPSGIPILIAQNGSVPDFIAALKSVQAIMTGSKN